MARSWRDLFKRKKNRDEESGTVEESREQATDPEEITDQAPAPGSEEVAAAEVEPPPEELPAEELPAEELPAEEAPVEEPPPEEPGIAGDTSEPGRAEEAPEEELSEEDTTLAEPEVVPEEEPEEEPAELPRFEAEPGEPVVEEEEPAQEVPADDGRGSWFGRLRSGLRRSRESVVGQLNAAVAEFKDVEDEEFWERVEEILIQSDVGVTTTAKLVGELEQEALERNITSGGELRELMIERATKMLDAPVELDISHEPSVILMVGVNGTGKTTTIGKMSEFLPGKVMFAAGDTFRAAAIEQLQTWGERTGTPVVSRQRGADAAAVAHDSVEEAKRTGTDVLLIDTAGRLHTKSNLMAELEKVERVIGRQMPGAPHETLMSVDATTGQNGLRQAKMFHESVGVTGIILTKLDGTAKGGIALAIANEIGVPIKLISVGEKVGDLHPFEAREFAEALFGDL
ncbi:signal recognition particle-docking protein FtsY [Rubrobacter aplysinae]|uniref:signal recognition particle-docking protein FtsY n=1 Tax=Rubrobacter aplysinae TaxID=909625 RepID=UPI00064C4316|nr:signal recognition particle-docking protein FtsY [Rubrobacter aplysinae]